MNLLLLCAGDPELRATWSGTAKSVVDQLRAGGHAVDTGDVELYGATRWLAAALAFSPDRRRWGIRYRLGAESFLRRSRRAGRHIASRRSNVDVILQIGATFAPARRHGTPYVLYCDSNVAMAERGVQSGHSQAASLRPAELRAIRRREVEVYGNAAAIFTISEQLRRSFMDDFAVPPVRVHTVYAGPNLDTSRVPDRAWDRGRDRPPTILFIGANFDRKGGNVLVEAFRRVRERIPAAELIVIGPARLEVREPGVRHLGFLDKDREDGWAALVDAYTSADVFCLPTRFEPFGIVFVEAMFFGLPCIGTDAWAVPEIIVDGETGFTVPVDDVDELADRLLRLLTNLPLARAMGRAGRARAEREFTWLAVAERMAQALEPIARRSATPG